MALYDAVVASDPSAVHWVDAPDDLAEGTRVVWGPKVYRALIAGPKRLNPAEMPWQWEIAPPPS